MFDIARQNDQKKPTMVLPRPVLGNTLKIVKDTLPVRTTNWPEKIADHHARMVKKF